MRMFNFRRNVGTLARNDLLKVLNKRYFIQRGGGGLITRILYKNPLSYRNSPLICGAWFLYDNDLRHESVKLRLIVCSLFRHFFHDMAYIRVDSLM